MTTTLNIHGGTSIQVRPTPAEHGLEPVTLTIYSGAACFQGYLTTDQARELAMDLFTTAEEIDGTTLHDAARAVLKSVKG